MKVTKKSLEDGYQAVKNVNYSARNPSTHKAYGKVLVVIIVVLLLYAAADIASKVM